MTPKKFASNNFSTDKKHQTWRQQRNNCTNKEPVTSLLLNNSPHETKTTHHRTTVQHRHLSPSHHCNYPSGQPVQPYFVLFLATKTRPRQPIAHRDSTRPRLCTQSLWWWWGQWNAGVPASHVSHGSGSPDQTTQLLLCCESRACRRPSFLFRTQPRFPHRVDRKMSLGQSKHVDPQSWWFAHRVCPKFV